MRISQFPKRLAHHVRSGTLGSTVLSVLRRRLLGHAIPIGDNYSGSKAEVYDSHRDGDPYWIAEHQATAMLLDQIEEVDSVLDLPFGTGRFLPLYTERGLRVSGIDSSQDMIDQATRKYPKAMAQADVCSADIRELPFPDGFVDVVVCFRFLPWIVSFADATLALQEMSRVSRRFAILELCVGKHKTGRGKTRPDRTLWDRLNEAELAEWLLRHDFNVLRVVPLHDDENHPGLTAFLCEKTNPAHGGEGEG